MQFCSAEGRPERINWRNGVFLFRRLNTNGAFDLVFVILIRHSRLPASSIATVAALTRPMQTFGLCAPLREVHVVTDWESVPAKSVCRPLDFCAIFRDFSQ